MGAVQVNCLPPWQKQCTVYTNSAEYAHFRVGGWGYGGVLVFYAYSVSAMSAQRAGLLMLSASLGHGSLSVSLQEHESTYSNGSRSPALTPRGIINEALFLE